MVHNYGKRLSLEWSLRRTLELESDKSRCFNHRDELESAVQLASKAQFGRILCGWRAIYYIVQASYYNNIYIRDYTSQATQHAAQVIITYSLNTCITRYSLYLPIFKSQKGSKFSHNNLDQLHHRIHHELHHNSLITTKSKFLLGILIILQLITGKSSIPCAQVLSLRYNASLLRHRAYT